MLLRPLVAWLVVVALCTLVGYPLAAVVFHRAPDRGAALALPCSLAVVTFVTYWVGQVTFGLWTAVFGVVVLAALSVLAMRVTSLPPRRVALEPAVVFAIAFVAMLVVRLADPAVIPQGGEKFLDYGLLKAIPRAEYLPPEDFWFAGERVRYYYGAHLVAGILSMLSGVEAKYAYNLVLPTFFACIATGAYGLGGWLGTMRGHSRRVAGVLAAFVVAFGNNLAPILRLLFGLLPDSFGVEYGRAVVAGIRQSYPAAYHDTVGLANWSDWHTRYVLDGTLVVSPSWEYVNGDLHAHVVAPVFTLLVVGCCLAWWSAPADSQRRWLSLAPVAPVAGILALTNLWSVPTALGLVFLTVALSGDHPLASRSESGRLGSLVSDNRLVRESSRLVVAGVVAGAVGVGAVISAAPFLLDHTPISRGVGFLPDRSALVPFGIAWGVFLVPFLGGLLPRLGSWAGASRTRTVAVASLAAAALAGLFVSFPALTLVGPLVLAGWVCSRVDHDYANVLVVAGAGLLLVIELAYARVWPLGANLRWNTVYKVSLQVWVLWGLAGGAVFAGWVGRIRAAIATESPTRRLPLREPTTALRAVVLVVLLVSTAAFPVLVGTQNVQPRIEGESLDDQTLDATKFVGVYHSDEATAIEWLNDREGTPTILTEGSGETYQWQSAPSALTGLPTVVGWEHEAGYRGVEAFRQRIGDTATMYAGEWSESARLLAKYDVRYIYVGPQERSRYEQAGSGDDVVGRHAFAQKQGISVAHESGDVVIYAVDETTMCAAANVTCPPEKGERSQAR
ncbi:DUF2298 domain-containing protein [Haloarchaeobius sp. DFWS5]|uniref:DUF2298 domain-containing protein n=1 Tax=Haloarchaeobius sp. DFWS5 TaxID=3446114 RepID=UPI003EBBB18A